MNEKYLPIGTVCRLKDGEKELMIIGFCVSEKDEDKMYDYLGCLYPEGHIGNDINFLFDHEQIEEILYTGLINDKEKEFKTKLREYIKEKTATNDFYNADKALNTLGNINTINLNQ